MTRLAPTRIRADMGPSAMETSLYFVASPLQLLNATEYRHWAGARSHDVVVSPVTEAGSVSHEQTRAAARLLGWDDPLWVTSGETNGALARWRTRHAALRELSLRYSKVDRMVVGAWGSHEARFLCAILRPQQLVLIDDGTSTPALAQTVAQRGFRTSAQLRRRPFATAAKWLLGHREPDVPLTQWFTVFDIPDDRQHRVVRNEYRWLREQLKDPEPSDRCWFIGSPYVDRGPRISARAYSATVHRAIEKGGFAGVDYIPHRWESARSVTAVAEHEAVTVKRVDSCVELALLTDPWPGVIAGFASTALHTMSAILQRDVRVVSFRFPPSTLTPTYRPIAAKIYEEFERSEIEVAELSASGCRDA